MVLGRARLHRLLKDLGFDFVLKGRGFSRADTEQKDGRL
jgi:predicted nucleic acid-binding Zn ribbon protein